ncbi:amidohydrolase [Shewanella colwelliana]|uniref:amidohydrolase family protein n=1 Tax=Shewanella colwelliana TaxID=23 RepID=UPI001BC1E99C|nr:amidohydrolase family protein [Shewanella colwelliana]MDX1281171.1 amidohydrolase family protein [Shewanella colwelliana]GIU29041.1 amidohydrolase [Shewanella colwelliana]
MKQFPRLLAVTCALSSSLVLAHDMVPASPQQGPIVIQNATLHTVIDGVQTGSSLRIEQGQIVAIGPEVSTQDAQVIDAKGKHVYPGLIALDTSMGLVEVEMMRPSNDSYEVGESNPQLLAISAFNPDSEIIPTVRVNGITHAQVVPQGEALAGQSSLVSLDSWTIEDALVPTQAQFHLYWPTLRRLAHDEETQKKQLAQYDAQLDTIETTLIDGYRYHMAAQAGTIDKTDNRWQAMQSLYQGKGQLFVHANSAEQIEQAIAMTKPYQFKLVIVGGYDAWRVADQLKEVDAKVIYTRTLSLPMRTDEPTEMSFKIPSLLKQADIPFALGFSSDWNARNLPFAAGQTVAYGLSRQEALKSITLDAAKILGLEDMGAIGVGYKANLIISAGDILDPLSSKIEALFIDGRQIDLNNRQQQLYQKYLKR